jgi:tetratricopeptide (TPR) repeat protein
MERRGDVKATYTLLAIAHGRLGGTDAARRAMLSGRRLPEITQWNDPYLGQALGLRVGRDAQFNRASDMIRERRFIEATQRLETIIRNYPDFERAHLNLGVALIESGNPESGESVLQAALARWPKSRELRNELGRALFVQGRTNEAETVFREVLRDDPNLPMAWFNLGQSLAKQSDWRGAADAFARTTRLSPELVVAHVDLGSSLLQSDRPTEAVAVFERALQLDPDNLQASAMLRTARERAMRP